MACKWLNSKGEVITTRTCREFAERFNMSVGVARNLHSGQRARMNGFCSMARKAKKQRERFMTRLVNIVSGETCILGQSTRQFCREHGLSPQALGELLCGHVHVYRYWMLEKAWKAING